MHVFVHVDKNKAHSPLCNAFCLCFLTLPYPAPCLLSSGHRSGLRASGVLWLSINSGVWSISLQLLQNNWAQRAVFKPGLVFNKRSFFYVSLWAQCTIFTAALTRQTTRKQRIVLSCIIITLFSLLFPLKRQTVFRKCCRHLVLYNSSKKWWCMIWIVGWDIFRSFGKKQTGYVWEMHPYPFNSPPADHLTSDSSLG